LSEEKLLLEDRNSSEEINKSIEDMEREREERLKHEEYVEKTVSEFEQASGKADDSVLMLEPVIEKAAPKSSKKKSSGSGAKQDASAKNADNQTAESGSDKPATKKKQSAGKQSEKVSVKESEAVTAEDVKPAPKPRKPKNIPLTDESKVAVGGLRIANKHSVDDPYGTKIVFDKPEKTADSAPKPPKPRNPRAEKAPRNTAANEAIDKDERSPESASRQDIMAVEASEENGGDR